jgi:HEPN domain-containing protein
MVDVEKQVFYWHNTSKDDWRVAKKLITDKEILHGLFFVHLTIEKALKAHVCKQTNDYAPLMHNLFSLAKLASIELTNDQEELLTEINTYNIRGRYPDIPIKVPSIQEAKSILEQAEDLYEWLIKQL